MSGRRAGCRSEAATLAAAAIALAAAFFPTPARGASPPAFLPVRAGALGPASIRLPGAHLPPGRGEAPIGVPRAAAALEFSFKNRDGYRIVVVGFGGTVSLTVSRNHSHSSTIYLARGKVSATSITASFAELGRVAVRFRPSGRVRRASSGPGCKGPGRKGPGRVVARYGTFVGDVSFSGEDGYTFARVHRAKGSSVSFPTAVVCSPSHPSPGRRDSRAGGTRAGRPGRAKVTTLIADWKLPLAKTLLVAQTFGRDTLFIVLADHSEGPIAVVHEAFALAPSPAFVSDSALSFASLAPPAPFSGTGSFQRGADGASSWTGSLAVSFPGAPYVPLTGPQFTVQLVRSL